MDPLVRAEVVIGGSHAPDFGGDKCNPKPTCNQGPEHYGGDPGTHD